jgi:hypothetical protein
MLDGRSGEALQKRDRQGRQKLLIPTKDESIIVDGVGRLFWMVG